MEKWTSLDDLLSYEVIPALGEFAKDFDAEAIAREAFEFDGKHWVQRDGVDFWEVAKKYDSR